MMHVPSSVILPCVSHFSETRKCYEHAEKQRYQQLQQFNGRTSSGCIFSGLKCARDGTRAMSVIPTLADIGHVAESTASGLYCQRRALRRVPENRRRTIGHISG